MAMATGYYILFAMVAYVTVAERKTMASMQRRLGPNRVGYWGLLQAFADALKLLIKEYIAPTQANIILFFLGPVITLVFSLLGYAVLPTGPNLSTSDFDLGALWSRKSPIVPKTIKFRRLLKLRNTKQ